MTGTPSGASSKDARPTLGRYGPVVATVLVLTCGALLSALLAFTMFFLQTRVYLPIGAISEDAANSALWNAMLAFLPLLLAYSAAWIVVPVCLLTAALSFLIPVCKRRRRLLVVSSVCMALVFLEAAAALAIERALFRRSFRNTFMATAARAQPTIDAIEAYKDVHGEYPDSLESLVPEFLSEVPDTGLAGYPEFEYSVFGDEKPHGNDYELRIDTPRGGINWDVFVYWPEGNYPDCFYGGVPELFGRWAYVHE